MKKIIFALFLTVALAAPAATVRYAATNVFGVADTNTIRLQAIGEPIRADGSFVTRGAPWFMRVTNGLATTNLSAGNYSLSNSVLRTNILFAVPTDTDTNNIYQIADLAISGFNTYNYSPGARTITGRSIEITNDGSGHFYITDTNSGSVNALTNNDTRSLTLTNIVLGHTNGGIVRTTNLIQHVVNPSDGTGLMGQRLGSGVLWQESGGGSIFGFGQSSFNVYTNFFAEGTHLTGLLTNNTTGFSAAANFYVATNGNNSTGSGKTNAPWRTIQYAATNSLSGEMANIFIGPGIYNEIISDSYGVKNYFLNESTVVSNNSSATIFLHRQDSAQTVMTVTGGTIDGPLAAAAIVVDNGFLTLNNVIVRTWSASLAAIELEGDSVNNEPGSYLIANNCQIIGAVGFASFDNPKGMSITLNSCSLITTNLEPFFGLTEPVNDNEFMGTAIVLNGTQSRCDQTNTGIAGGFGSRIFGQLTVITNLY